MANWSLQGPFPYKSVVPSNWATDLDEYLTKVPNWIDGSDHTAASQVILRGAGLYVVGAFRADDAQVTISSGKSFIAASGATFTVQTLGTFTKGLAVTQGTSNTNGITAAGNGTGIGISATGGANARGGEFQAGGGNNLGVYAVGSGTGAGISAVGGSSGSGAEIIAGGGNAVGMRVEGAGSGVGAVVAPGTPSLAAIPQCAVQLSGYIEITADDPVQGVVPPDAHVAYGLSFPKAYCSVEVGTVGPYVREDSHNIAVVDDVALGNYSVTFLRAMAVDTYVVVATSNFAGMGIACHTKTTNGFRFTVYDTSTNAASATVVTVDLVVFGRR